jgi:hypothetical protein
MYGRAEVFLPRDQYESLPGTFLEFSLCRHPGGPFCSRMMLMIRLSPGKPPFDDDGTLLHAAERAFLDFTVRDSSVDNATRCYRC